jgi:hypothetical protein
MDSIKIEALVLRNESGILFLFSLQNFFTNPVQLLANARFALLFTEKKILLKFQRRSLCFSAMAPEYFVIFDQRQKASINLASHFLKSEKTLFLNFNFVF